MCPSKMAAREIYLKTGLSGQPILAGIGLGCARTDLVNNEWTVITSVLQKAKGVEGGSFWTAGSGCVERNDDKVIPAPTFLSGFRFQYFAADNETLVPFTFAGWCDNKNWASQKREELPIDLATGTPKYCPADWAVVGTQIQTANFTMGYNESTITGVRFFCAPKIDVCGGCYNGHCNKVAKVCGCDDGNWRGDRCEENRLIYPTVVNVMADTNDGIIDGSTLKCNYTVPVDRVDPTRTLTYFELSNGEKVSAEYLQSQYTKAGLAVRCAVSLTERTVAYAPFSDPKWSPWVLIAGLVRQLGDQRPGWTTVWSPSAGAQLYIAKTGSKTVEAAQAACASIGMDLLVPTSDLLQDAAITLLKGSSYTNAYVAYYSKGEVKQWLTKYVPGYRPAIWTETYYDPMVGGCTYLTTDGSWNTGSCLEAAVICQLPRTAVHTIVGQSMGGTAQSWDSAKSFCETTWGGQLLSVQDSTAKGQLATDLKTVAPSGACPNSWVGIRAETLQSANPTWTDGLPFDDKTKALVTPLTRGCAFQDSASTISFGDCAQPRCFFCNAKLLEIQPYFDSIRLVRSPQASAALLAQYHIEYKLGENGATKTINGALLPYVMSELKPGSTYFFRLRAKERLGDTVGVIPGAPPFPPLFENLSPFIGVSTSCDCEGSPYSNGAPEGLSYKQKNDLFTFSWFDRSACDSAAWITAPKGVLLAPWKRGTGREGTESTLATADAAGCTSKVISATVQAKVLEDTLFCLQAKDTKAGYLSPMMDTSCKLVQPDYFAQITGRVVGPTGKGVQRVSIAWAMREYKVKGVSEALSDTNGNFVINIQAKIPVNSSVTVQLTPARDTAGHEHIFDIVAPITLIPYETISNVVIRDTTNLFVIPVSIKYAQAEGQGPCPGADIPICVRAKESSDGFCKEADAQGRVEHELVVNSPGLIFTKVLLGSGKTDYGSEPISCGSSGRPYQDTSFGAGQTTWTCLYTGVPLANNDPGAQFVVTTTVPLKISVGAGSEDCKIGLGNAQLTISAVNSGTCKFAASIFTSGGDLRTIQVPPIKMKVVFNQFEAIPGNPDAGLFAEAEQKIKSRYPAGEQIIDLRTSDRPVRFEFHTVPQVTLIDIEGGKQCGDRWVVNGGEGVKQVAILHFRLEEIYGSYGTCYPQGTVLIRDQVTDQIYGEGLSAQLMQQELDRQKREGGPARTVLPVKSCYTMDSCEAVIPPPEEGVKTHTIMKWTVIPGDIQLAPPYTRQFYFRVASLPVAPRKPDYGNPIAFPITIIGTLTESNADAILLPQQSMKIPDFILYDPPGSMSVASLQGGHRIENTVTWSGSEGVEFATEFELSVGLSMKFGVCTCGLVVLECEDVLAFDISFGVSLGFKLEGEVAFEKTTTHGYNIDREISTAEGFNQIDGYGDIIFISTIMWKYTAVRRLEITQGANGCEVVSRKSFKWDLDASQPSQKVVSFSSVYDILAAMEVIKNLISVEASLGAGELRVKRLLDGLEQYQRIYNYWKRSRDVQNFERAIRLSQYVEQFGTSSTVGGILNDITQSSWGKTLAQNEMINNRYFFSGGGQTTKFSIETSSQRTALTTFGSTFTASIGGFFEGGPINARLSSGSTTKMKKDDQKKTAQLHTITWTFGDKDVGDEFGVEVWVNLDYGTPIFKTISGRSSCPWEAGTLTRNAPYLDLSTSTITNADPSEPAHLTLTLGNGGDTVETEKPWVYILNAYNPDGLEMSVAGLILFDSKFYLHQEPLEVELTLNKKLLYDYPDTVLVLSPACEFGIDLTRPPLEASAPISISFMYECAPMDWVGVWAEDARSKYFVVNAAPEILIDDEGNERIPQKDLLRLVVKNTDYPSSLWSDNKRLREVVAEYKNALDTDWSIATLAGSGERAVLVESDYGYAEAVINTSSWLEDGTYMVRVRSECLPITGFEKPQFLRSKTVPRSGIVDRTPPFVIRELTQPADESFWPGDEIKVRYSKPLNCFLPATRLEATIQLDDQESAGYLSDGWLDVMCEKDSLYFSYGHLFDYGAARGKTAEITVWGAQDLAGNLQESQFSFKFQIEPTEQNALSFAVLGYIVPETMADYMARVENEKAAAAKAMEAKRYLQQDDLTPTTNNVTSDEDRAIRTAFTKQFIEDIIAIMKIADPRRIAVIQITPMNTTTIIDMTIQAGSPDAATLYKRLLTHDQELKAAAAAVLNGTANTTTTDAPVAPSGNTTTDNSTTSDAPAVNISKGGLTKSSSYLVGTSQYENKQQDAWKQFWAAANYDVFQFLFIVSLSALIPFLIFYVIWLFTKPSKTQKMLSGLDEYREDPSDGYHRM